MADHFEDLEAVNVWRRKKKEEKEDNGGGFNNLESWKKKK